MPITLQYGNIPGPNRTAKTLATRVGKSFPTSSAPPVSNLGGMNAIDFSGGGKAFQIDSVDASWAATSQNATDGGTNGKLWFGNQGQFTIEFWVYFSTINPQIGLMEFGTSGPAIGLRTASSIFFAISGSSYFFNPTVATFVSGQWYHIAFTRQVVSANFNLYLWINGVYQSVQLGATHNFTGSVAPFFGSGIGSNDLNGYMQDIRISNIARYAPTVNFTPPTTPFVNDNNTVFLVHGSSPIADDNIAAGGGSGGLTLQYNSIPGPTRTAKTLATPSGKVAPTSVSPPQPNLGSNALQFTTNSAVALTNVNANWGATAVNSTDGGLNGKLWLQNQGQFTVEFFINLTSSLSGLTMIDWGSQGLAIGYLGNRLYFGISGSSFYFEPLATIVQNTWYHIALTREFVGGALRIYAWLNGTYLGTSTSPNWTGTGDVIINRTSDWAGYLQEVRISNIARYAPTVNFTPTTTPFVNDANTLFLLHGTTPIQDDIVSPATAGGITLQFEPGVIATGGTITDITVGNVNYRVHTFTSTGSFIVTNGGNVEYFIVGGGGGGGRGGGGNHGGGGAGGLIPGSIPVTPQTYTVTVGAGGTFNAQGANSSFAGQNAVGGGFGGTGGGTYNGGAGGSGGGGGSTSPSPQGFGGAGTAGQGYAGGNGAQSTSFSCGGGGGAGAVGDNAVASGVGAGAGSGGIGIQSNFNGTSTYYAGGGGGAAGNFGGAVVGVGGLGGGGAGAYAANTFPGTSGTTNTGGGGGGGTFNQTTTSGLPGGSGIVMIRYIL